MIAYVLHGKKDLRAEERPIPNVGPGEVLIQVRRMGICGSDVHYFSTGHCGAFVPQRPFVLGHECAGEIVETGADVTELVAGERVAVDPSRPCRRCQRCLEGRSNLCENMKYLGSASTDPHVDGAFASHVAVPAENCHRIPDEMTYAEATMLEPLSVATHAVARAGDLVGKSVLIVGGGTMGQLVLLAARAMGAATVAVVDLRSQALDLASAQGADHVCEPQRARDLFGATLLEGFDVIFEASGAPASLRLALESAARGGTIVQLGTLPGEVELPVHLIMQKELQVAGSFRFANVFADALDLIAARKVDVRPIITRTFGFGELVTAFDTAVEDKNSFKIQVKN